MSALNFWKIAQGINLTPKTSAPSSPSNGDMYYNSTSNLFQFYQNGSFVGVGGDLSNGGNTFGTTMTIGTNDAFSLAFETNNAVKGSITSAGLWTIGESASTQTHVVNGSIVNFTPSTASSDMTIQHGQQQGRMILSSDNRGFDTRGGSIVLYGNGHATKNDNIEFYRAGTLTWNMSSSGGVVFTTTPGTIVAGRQLFANSTTNDNNSIIAVGNSTPSITGSTQVAFNSTYAASSAATSAIYGFLNQTTTAAAAFTAPIRAGFYHANITKGAGSTITRDIGFLVEKPTQGANNASISDNTAFSGAFFINQTGQAASFFSGNQTWQTGSSGTHTFKTDAGNFGPNVRLEVSDSATTADAIITFSNNAGAGPWTMGRDTSDSNKFKIAQRDGGFVGSNEFFIMTVGGVVSLGDPTGSTAAHKVYGADFLLESSANTGFSVNATGSGSTAYLDLNANAATTVDSYALFRSSSNSWAVGKDTSDSHAFKVSWATTLGTNDFFKITTVGDVKVQAGTGTTLVGVGGAYSVNVNEVANSGTGETDLQSFTIAANTLNADGDALEFEWFGTTSGTNVKTLRLYVDGTVHNSVVLPTSNSRFRAKIYIHRSTTNVVKGYAEILSRDSTPTGNLLTEYIEENVTLTSSFVVKLTGQSDTASNEIVSRGARADWKPTN